MEIKFKMHVFLIFFCTTLIFLYNPDKFSTSYGLTAKEKITKRIEDYFQIPDDPEQSVIFSHFVNQASKCIAAEDTKTADILSLMTKQEPLFSAVQKAVSLEFELEKLVFYEYLHKNIFFVAEAAQILSEPEIITTSEKLFSSLSDQIKTVLEEIKHINPTVATHVEDTFKEIIILNAHKSMVLSSMETSKYIVKSKIEILRNVVLEDTEEEAAMQVVKEKMEFIMKCPLWLMSLNKKIKNAFEKTEKLCLSFEPFVQFEISKVLLKTYMWFYLKNINIFWLCEEAVDGILLLGTDTKNVYRFKNEDKEVMFSKGTFSLQKELNTYVNQEGKGSSFWVLLEKASVLLYPFFYLKNLFFRPPDFSEEETVLLQGDSGIVYNLILNDVKLFSKVLNQPDYPQIQTSWIGLDSLKEQELQKTFSGLFNLLKNVFGDNENTDLDFTVEEEEETKTDDDTEKGNGVEAGPSYTSELYKDKINSVLTELPTTIEGLYDYIDLPSGIKESVLSFVQSAASPHMIYFGNFVFIDDLEDLTDFFVQLDYDPVIFLKYLLQLDKNQFVRAVMKFLNVYVVKLPFNIKAIKKEKKTPLLDIMTKLAAFNLLLDIEEGKNRDKPLLKALTVPYWKRQLVELSGFLNKYLTLNFLNRQDLVLSMTTVEFLSELYSLFIKLTELRQRETKLKHSKKERKEAHLVLLLLQYFFKPGYMNTLRDRIGLLKRLQSFMKKNDLAVPIIPLNFPEVEGHAIETLDHLVFGMIPQEKLHTKYMIKQCVFKENNQVNAITANVEHAEAFQPKRDILIKTSEFSLLILLRALIQIYNEQLSPKQIKLMFTNTRTSEDLEVAVTDIFVYQFEDPVSSKGKLGKKKGK